MKRLFLGIMAATVVFGAALAATLVVSHRRGVAEPSPSKASARAPEQTSLDDRLESMEPIQPIPLHIELDAKRVALGAKLFQDRRLSANDQIACASCHSLAHAGVDGKVRSVGIYGQVGLVNAPTVFNSGFNFKQFWDGRAETLEDQVAGPLQNPLEMGSSFSQVLGKLRRDPALVRAFASAYQDGLTPLNLENAIATFERSLYTPNSRFDKYLRGDSRALTDDEKIGYQLFKSYGCATCHQGVNVGGNMFEQFGLMANYFADRGGETKADLGRFNVTGREEDRHVFRVPSLRLVALTAPYFHDGSAKRLEDAVRVMAKYQLGRQLSDEDVRRIVLFLNTLPGEYRGRALVPATAVVADVARR